MPPRRIKTYPSELGHVYQYFFVGQREALEDFGIATTEYIFDVVGGQPPQYSVSVFLGTDALSAWQTVHGRSLTSAERYAVAKLRLCKAFDEIEVMFQDGRRLRVEPGRVEELLEPLKLDD